MKKWFKTGPCRRWVLLGGKVELFTGNTQEDVESRKIESDIRRKKLLLPPWRLRPIMIESINAESAARLQ